jgi:hypothetical protein
LNKVEGCWAYGDSEEGNPEGLWNRGNVFAEDRSFSASHGLHRGYFGSMVGVVLVDGRKFVQFGIFEAKI